MRMLKEVRRLAKHRLRVRVANTGMSTSGLRVYDFEMILGMSSFSEAPQGRAAPGMSGNALTIEIEYGVNGFVEVGLEEAVTLDLVNRVQHRGVMLAPKGNRRRRRNAKLISGLSR